MARLDVQWNRAAALLLLAATATASWWPVLGSGLLWATPIALIAGLIVARVIPVQTGAVAALLWIPIALLLAGVPLDALRPREWGATGSALRDGFQAAAGAGGGRILDDPYALAAALIGAGVTWCIAASLATRGTAPTVTAVLILLQPVMAAILLENTPPNAAWHGAALLAAAVLWSSRGRLALVLPLTALVSLVAVTGAQAFGPHDRWLRFDRSPIQPPFTRLDPTQSYGPLDARRTGAKMFEITSPEPALWRMHTLEDFDGRGWRFSQDDIELPEPAAVEVTSTVRYGGLTNRRVPAPGRITSIDGEAEGARGEGWRLESQPSKGHVYTVRSKVVRATAAQLATVKIPHGENYDHVTRFWPRRRGGTWPPARLAQRMPAWLDDSPWGDAIQLAHTLSAGTQRELEVVKNVEDYLKGGRYRYTTDVGDPGPEPLLDFLFKTREGYCQHFAGAATLLLRLAGVPTRVVTGFATGKRTGEDTYSVRDEDAHAWIEVYFPGYGWVPFNPTPSAAEAEVAPETDVFAEAGVGGGSGAGTPLVAAAALVLLGGVALLRRRRTPVALGEVLASLAGADSSTTLTALKPCFGPHVAALVDLAERARFAEDGTQLPSNPRWRVFRALTRDVGVRAALSRLATRPGPARTS